MGVELVCCCEFVVVLICVCVLVVCGLAFVNSVG